MKPHEQSSGLSRRRRRRGRGGRIGPRVGSTPPASRPAPPELHNSYWPWR